MVKKINVEAREELAKLENELLAQAQEPLEDSDKQTEESETDVTDSTPVEDKPQEESTQEGAIPEETTDLEVGNLKDKAQKRFQEITRENRELKERLSKMENLSVNREDIDFGIETPKPVFPWEEQSQPTITVEDYKKHVSEAARKAAQDEIRVERLLSRVELDAEKIEQKYPELNSESPEWDPSLADFVKRTFSSSFKEDNNYRFLDHVDQVMALRTKSVNEAKDKAKKEVTAKVALQSAEQAVAPSVSEPRREDSLAFKIKKARTLEELEDLENYL